MEKQRKITLNADKRKVIADQFQSFYEDKVKDKLVQAKEQYDIIREKAKEVILPIVESGKEVHLNIKDVSYMDSSGISVLIESHQKALENNTKVVVKEVSKSVLKVIMMAKLEQILNLE